MTKDEWVFKNALHGLDCDTQDCERLIERGEQPSYDLLGTLRVNLEVSWGKLHAATADQAVVFKGLKERADKILGRGSNKKPEGL